MSIRASAADRAAVSGVIADVARVAALVSAVIVFVIGRPEPAFRFAVVFLLLLVPRWTNVPRVFQAVFCVALVVAGWAGAAHWYEVAWWVDVLVHFVLPGVTAAMTYFVLVHCHRLPDLDDRVFARHRSAVAIVVVALGLAIGALWEMYEWAAVALFSSVSIETDYDDTILDLAMGGTGSLVASMFVIWWGSRGNSVGGRRPTDAQR